MRQLGTLDPNSAERFANALRTRGIMTKLRPVTDGVVEIWINEEDQLERARRELEEFEAHPAAAKFDPPPSPPEVVGASTSQTEPAPLNRKQPWRRLPLTCALIGISVVVCLVIWAGGDFGEHLRSDLAIAPVTLKGDGGAWFPQKGLSAVRDGQFWRLVTPIFPHADPLHLLFNMAWLWLLGAAVETVRGSWRMLMFVVVAAVASNLAEYYWDFGFAFDQENGLKSDIKFDPNPMFLGMSGVITALFGFVWMRARFVPGSDFVMPRDTVVWMLIWLVVCTSGLVGNIANVAHGIGLLTGIAIGFAPRLRRRA